MVFLVPLLLLKLLLARLGHNVSSGCICARKGGKRLHHLVNSGLSTTVTLVLLVIAVHYTNFADSPFLCLLKLARERERERERDREIDRERERALYVREVSANRFDVDLVHMRPQTHFPMPLTCTHTCIITHMHNYTCIHSCTYVPPLWPNRCKKEARPARIKQSEAQGL